MIYDMSQILFLSTVAFNSMPAGWSSFIVANVLYEGRMLLDIFPICNDYPSFLKLLLFIPFALGHWSVRIFSYLRIPMIALLTAQFVCQIGGWSDPWLS
jgi:hypothetical protein